MAAPGSGTPRHEISPELLGYLNFSSGTSDSQFLKRLDGLFAAVGPQSPRPDHALLAVYELLSTRLSELAASTPAFADAAQAKAVLALSLLELPARYRQFHRDLLFHQADRDLFSSLFAGRMFEAVLAQGGPWDETERILDGAIAQLNDYIGHRPVATLYSDQRQEPYRHEWIRPVPLFIRGVGVGESRYRPLIARALEILAATDRDLLAEAWFNPELLDELAFDPRAYDFDHPVNKRPNYHFGQWDPQHLDAQGRYRRFVVQQVTLDTLLERVEQAGPLPREELLTEAAAVLAGTMLMASGTSGSGPESHDSTMSLATLVPKIAAYRDKFYERYVKSTPGAHGDRLRKESIAGKQPLAGARQFLNQRLARRRAAQLEHVRLAQVFARMGFPQAALRQAQVVPVASARMACEIQCRLTTGHLAIDHGQLEQADGMLSAIEDYLHRGIECGALVDPWNMLGFQGQFSLFPSPENSVVDHRVESLVDLLEEIMGLYSRLWSEAAAHDDDARSQSLSKRMQKLARWWDRFAADSVSGIDAFAGAQAYESAREVARAMQAFHKAGAAAGDIGFWRQHVSSFNSPKAYALVVDALWQKADPVAAMALLMQWLSQAGKIPLAQGEYSFHDLARRWLAGVCQERGDAGRGAGLRGGPPLDAAQRQTLLRRFFELLEANAEDLWQPPVLDLPWGQTQGSGSDDAQDEAGDDDAEEDDDGNVYGAAYDDVVYIDSTQDGIDADMLEAGGPATQFELDHEARRVNEHLAFMRTVASLWKQAVVSFGPHSPQQVPEDARRRWVDQADENERGLLKLLSSVVSRKIPAPSASRDSLMEFEQRRYLQDSLAEKIIGAVVETADAARTIRATLLKPKPKQAATPAVERRGPAVLDDLTRAVLRGDADTVRELWPEFLEQIAPFPLLYVPPSKGGDPLRAAATRSFQQSLRELLERLPRLGLVAPTCQLIEAARLMESGNPVGAGAISEYDRLFSAGYEALVEALVDASLTWPPPADDPELSDRDLIECLEQLTESLLKQWLAHSRTLRLNVIEKIADGKAWKALVKFIETYGRDLFAQPFLSLGNLRAILHQGVDAWLTKLVDNPPEGDEPKLLTDLDKTLPRAQAVQHLSLVIEAIAENYNEYRDYNSTTTQSDRGDLLYTLLDFLRLRVHYDRVAWHLKPVMIAHAVLVRRGRTAAAEQWRRAMAERTSELADSLEKQAADLRQKYAMRLPTVSDRLAERFIRPLAIDRLRALVQPAIDDVRARQSVSILRREAEPDEGEQGPLRPALQDEPTSVSFQLLEQETEELMQEPTGSGLDAPPWLQALEQEVASASRASGAHGIGIWSAEAADPAPQHARAEQQTPLTMEEVQAQLTGWEQEPE